MEKDIEEILWSQKVICCLFTLFDIYKLVFLDAVKLQCYYFNMQVLFKRQVNILLNWI